MVDEHKLLRDSGKSVEAQSLLDNAMFNEAHAAIESQLLEAWFNTSDPLAQNKIWFAVQANRKHKGYFQSVLSDGKMAAAELKELAESAERKRFFSR